MTIETDSETATSDLDVAVRPVNVASISPASASPILVETIVIQFNNAYPSNTIDADTFTVNLVPRDPDLTRPNGDAKRPLNVVSRSAAEKTITVKYGGAYSGVYDVEINSLANGNLDVTTNNISFESVI